MKLGNRESVIKKAKNTQVSGCKFQENTHMQIRPLGDRVVVKPISKEEVTKSGIVIPDTIEKERPEQGEVVAIGPGKLLENGQRSTLDVKVGDRVIFSKYGPSEVKVEKEEYLIIKEEDILAVLQ